MYFSSCYSILIIQFFCMGILENRWLCSCSRLRLGILIITSFKHDVDHAPVLFQNTSQYPLSPCLTKVTHRCLGLCRYWGPPWGPICSYRAINVSWNTRQYPPSHECYTWTQLTASMLRSPCGTLYTLNASSMFRETPWGSSKREAGMEGDGNGVSDRSIHVIIK